MIVMKCGAWSPAECPENWLEGSCEECAFAEVRTKKEGDSMKYEVIEDNAGQLYLFVSQDGEIVYAADGFEHFQGVLKESLEDLARTGTVEDWEPGNIENPEEVYETLQNWINEGMGGAQLIADQDGVYPDRMGAAGMIEFGIEE